MPLIGGSQATPRSRASRHFTGDLVPGASAADVWIVSSHAAVARRIAAQFDPARALMQLSRVEAAQCDLAAIMCSRSLFW